MNRFGQSVLSLLVIALFSIGAFGCNTIHGAGRDIEKGGEKVQEASENAQK